MRKKSHISLAGQLFRGLDMNEILKHKYFFYMGNILPDCRPSFLTTPHRVEETFDMVMVKIGRWVDDGDSSVGMNRRRTVQLGEILHYIADYFTFPHNDHYSGGLKDHCNYESDLKKEMYRFVKSKEANDEMKNICICKDKEELCQYIQRMHRRYVRKDNNVFSDCKYITRVCLSVVVSIVYMTFGVNLSQEVVVAA